MGKAADRAIRRRLSQAQRELGIGEVSYVPEDSAALRGLAQVNRGVVRELSRRRAAERIATIDMDATVIESWKREAEATTSPTTTPPWRSTSAATSWFTGRAQPRPGRGVPTEPKGS